METQTKKINELLRLIAENPFLPIVPMVDSEIVADDGCNRWLGAWGSAAIDEYLVSEERIYFRDNDDLETVLTDVIGCDAYEAMSDEEATVAHQALPWIKAIIVNIDLP